jgi:hypothetical protein
MQMRVFWWMVRQRLQHCTTDYDYDYDYDYNNSRNYHTSFHWQQPRSRGMR